MLLDVAHGGIDLRADVLGFGVVEQVIEPRLGGRMVGSIASPPPDATLTLSPSPSGREKQFRTLGGEADFGEAQEAEAKDGRGVFLGLEARVGAELWSAADQRRFSRAALSVSFSDGAIHYIRPETKTAADDSANRRS